MRSKVDFVRRQGFTTEGCQEGFYSALMFQPRVIGVVVALSVILQSPWIFLMFSTVLWWNALVPSHNPFTAFYNHVLADPRQVILSAAPPPRRFAEGLAGTLAMIIAIALFAEASIAAWLLEAIFAAAVTAVVVGRRCLAAELYQLLRPQTPARPCQRESALPVPR